MMELSQIPLFAQLSDAGQRTLRHGITQKLFTRGTSLLHQGQPVSGAYFVLSGRLRIYTVSSSGVEATLYTLQAGETCILALNALFNDVLYPAWVQTETDTSVAIISGSTFRELFQTETSIRDTIVHSLATMVFGLMEQLQQVHTCSLEQRLAHFIIARSSSDGTLQMTQQLIAQHLGTSREVIARLIGTMVHQNLVHTQRGRLHIKDAQTLSNIATFGHHNGVFDCELAE